jgi:hypothetical protein
LNPEDDEAFLGSLAQIDSSAKTLQVLQGSSPEQTQVVALEAKSEAAFERVTTLARTNPEKAESVLKDAVEQGYITGEHAGRAGAFIRNQRNLQSCSLAKDCILAQRLCESIALGRQLLQSSPAGIIILGLRIQK